MCAPLSWAPGRSPLRCHPLAGRTATEGAEEGLTVSADPRWQFWSWAAPFDVRTPRRWRCAPPACKRFGVSTACGGESSSSEAIEIEIQANAVLRGEVGDRRGMCLRVVRMPAGGP